MSWLDTINNDFIIITGDGKEYRPKWLNATRNKEFNVSDFEFINISGTLVKRTKAKGTKYNLELYFDGEDHQDTAGAFFKSADDEREWTIIHPKYGTLIVQPSSLIFDDRDYNVTKITGTVTETITDSNPKVTVNPGDKVTLDQVALNTVFEESFVNDVPVPSSSVKNQLTKNVDIFYKLQAGAIKTAQQSEDYFNLFNKANAAILNATTVPLEAIRATQAAINAPFLFSDSVKNRIANMIAQFNALNQSIDTLTGKSNKKVYENNGGVLISAMAAASVTNYDYANRGEVEDTITKITDSHSEYLTALDGLQSDDGGTTESFIPDFNSQMALSDLVSFTVSNLFEISKNSKQERSFYLEEDSNIIILTHRLFGLLPDDSTIDMFININNIGLNELLQIKKGRLITYYF